MKIKFRQTRVFTFLLTLLLLGGVANQAWAVRYHILTLPFDVRNYNNTDYYKQNIRVEALLVISDVSTVGLPEEYQSPLAKNFHYYASWVTPEYTYLYDYTHNSKLLKVKYNLYSHNGGSDERSVGSAVGDLTDIYVTYEYDNTKGILLDGTQDYNIGVGTKYLCYNRSRNNRLANANSAAITGEHLASQDFVTPEAGTKATQMGFNWSNDQWAGTPGAHFGFWLTGYKQNNVTVPDPYNITIKTAFTGDGTYVKDAVDGDNNKAYVKPYKGATLFSKMTSQDDGKGSDDKMWFDCDDNVHYKGVPGSAGIDDPASANYWEKQVDQWPGYYRYSQQPAFNSVAILNRPGGGYVFVASKLNQGVGNDAYKEWAPNKNGNYPTLTDNNNLNPKMAFKALDKSPVINIYKIRTYTFKIKTHVSENILPEDMRWSDAKASSKIVDLIPETLKRKYCTYKAYTDEALTNEISTFEDAITHASEEGGKKVIWLKYETNMPFETSATSATYDNLKWYNFYTNKEEQYIVRYNSTSTSFNTTGSDGSRYARTSHFAFVGDPYELKIVSRKLADDNSGTLRYLKLNDPVTGNITQDATGTAWDIVYDDNTGTHADCFRLREYTTTNNSTNYLGWAYGTSNYPLKGVTTEDAATRLKVIPVPTKTYVYHIMRSDHSIAAKASVSQDASTKLDFAHIPEIIRSPFLALTGVTLKFYDTESKAQTNADDNDITYAPDDETSDSQEFWVRYDMGTALDNTPGSYIKGETAFNVRLNGQYIYYDNGTIKTTPESAFNDDCATNPAYQWRLGGSDPYAMTVLNVGANKYVTVDYAPLIAACQAGEPKPDGEITWSDTPSKFIIKGTSRPHIYEVMAALGEDVDSRSNYFNIGCPSENTVKLYGNESYVYNSATLRFELTPTTGTENLMYHLIDKAGKDLLQMPARQVSTGKPEIPEYWSPLVKQYHYYKIEDFTVVDNVYTLNGSPAELEQVTNATDADTDGVKDIFVTYTANDLVDMQGRTTYLMKYVQGENFRQEDGVDDLLPEVADMSQNTYRYKAVYPYCNGDCNFFVYGQEQYDIQQQGAASTRTRWAWYVESVNNDPYHVKIFSRQQETYPAGSGNDYNAYFRTYAETYGGSKHVVTTLAWPGISGQQGTEYMVLGSAGQFRLLTTDKIAIDLNGDSDTEDEGESNERRAVNSFEQYWKTWNTIRLKVLGDKDATAKQSDPNTVPETPATKVASDAGEDNRTYLTDVMGWHSYEQWAYAIRWNDYNKDGDKNKKGWESIEHWYQTVNMGEGYFDFEKTTIEPVLILLDQHGWEIMRKPLPSDPNDPEKYAKYDAIRPYDSPMVKEYAFWKTAKKRTGFHQYYLLSDRIGGEDFTSTSLTDLPPYDSENVKDAKGNLLDQYVTYIVKDEYAQTYNPSSKTGQPFIIQQGTHFAYNNSDAATVGKEDVPATGGMSQYIISNISDLTTTGDKKDKLWYVKPNADIDIEMGYQDETKFPGGYAHSWDSKTPNAYEDKYKDLKAAVYVKETPEYKNASADDKKKLTDKYGEFSFSNGFDPYNIQISSVSSVSNGEKFFVTNATKAEIDEGSILGDGTTNTLIGKKALPTTLVGGMDNRTLQMTNATFMAVQDAAGNMQLMPRFDQERRLKDFSTLVHTDDAEEAKTHTKLYRPLVYNYHIIDNSGNESLRYQSGGDLQPQTPEWFKSPLAKDYKYYAGISGSTGENEITESLAGATLTDNKVYVRYSYNKDADSYQMLQGKWLTMTLNAKNAVYSDGVKQASVSKPDPVDASYKDWQWKFLADSQTDPDPYAVSLYNRNTDAGTSTPVNSKTKFALLNWYNGVVDASAFTLAVHGLGTVDNYDYTYQFVNGASMNTETAATTTNEANVKSTSCSYNSTDARIVLTDDVSHTYTYKVYTNDDPVTPAHEGKYGKFAVSAEQDNITIAENDYVPILPEEIRSPLLNIDQFKYYGAEADMGDATKELKNIFGLYDDIIYVRYTDYDLKATEYKVPNVKTVVDSKVARGEESNDAALDINKELIYNIIWYDDNMMKAVDTTVPADGAYDGISSETNHALDGDAAYVWQFEGNDPYAIKIKHKSSGKYAVGTDALASTATSTFMLLPSTDTSWEYGVLAKTGDSRHQLSGSGNTLADTQATPTPGTPTKFIIFGLSTHKVIYHLVIANIGNSINIPYRETKGGSETTKPISGSTQRDLTTNTTITGDTYQLGSTINGVNYCVDDGHITLGDPLKVPDALKRPNCKYFYYVEGIYTDGDCDRSNHLDATLDGQYRGLQITQMGTEPELLGKTVVINVVYAFDDGLPTNNGANFVTDKTGTQWFTMETSDETPYLSRVTSESTIQSAEGREPHYTNEFLWKPIGDPYGFKMYNRYIYKNAGHTTQVMTTTESPADGQSLTLGSDTEPKTIYELFAGETDGYFIMRPMLNNNVAIYNNAGTMSLSSTNATEWTFGLSETLFKPYRDRAGYVGGLNDTGKTAYDDAAGNLQTIQGIVYNDDNIVSFAPGYYRLHNLPNTDGITTPRYMSGYLHEIEKTYVSGGIPMHFYSRKGVNNNTFESLESGYTVSPATQGQIPIPATEYDPSSIFYITGSASGAQMHTQGLNVIGNKMGTGDGTSFHIVDIGGACVVIYDGSNNYLSYNGTNKYDIGYDAMTASVAERSKWCLEPANNMGLYIKTHSGGEEETLTNLWYYSSYCVPFDLLIANKNEDEDHSSNAYTCVADKSPWPGTAEDARVGLHPKSIGKYNTGTYKDNDYFVPAGTPVLFSTKRAKDYIKATIPTTTPSTAISTIFSYQYLEQLLTGWDDSQRVYVFGPKMQGTMEINTSDGTVNATLPSLGNTNVGFHLNANPNKEAGLTPASWTRHNYYVLHNRIYYKAGGSGASPAPTKRAPEFVPVIFDDDEEQQELNPDGTMESVGDGCIYDLMGRKVATREQVEDGSWKQRVATGIYILNGKKFQKK